MPTQEIQFKLLLLQESGTNQFVKECLTGDFRYQLEVMNAKDILAVKEQLEEGQIDVILFDFSAYEQDVNCLLAQIEEVSDRFPLIAILSQDNTSLGLQLLELGFQDYLIKEELNFPHVERVFLAAIARFKRQRFQREQENISRDIIDQCSLIPFKINLDGHWEFLSSNWTNLIGINAKQCLGQSFLDYLYPDDRQNELNRFQALVSGIKDNHTYETRFQSQDETIQWVEVYITRLVNAKGEVIGVGGFLKDIADKKQTEEAHNWEYNELAIRISEKIIKFNHVANDVTRLPSEDSQKPEDSGKNSLSKTLPDLRFRCRRNGFFIDIESEQNLSIDSWFCSSEKFISNLEEDLLVQIAEKGKEAFIQAISTGKTQTQQYQLYLNGENRDFEVHFIVSEKDDVLIIVRDIFERKQTEAALLNSENRFQTLVSNLPGVVYRGFKDPVWTMEFISEGIEELTGYLASDFILNQKRTYTSIIHPEDAPYVDHKLRNAIAQRQPYSLEYRIICADGDICWVNEYGRGIFSRENPNELICLDGVILDISDRILAEEALQESQRRLNGIMNALDDVVWSACANTLTLHYLNPAVEKVYDRPLDQFSSSPRLWLDVIHPDDRPGVEVALQVIRHLGSQEIEYRILQPSGQVRWLRSHATLVKDDQGNPILIDGITTDITEHKLAEENLRRERQQLQQIIVHAPVAMAMFDGEMRYIAHSEQWQREYGLEKQFLIGRSQYDLFPNLPSKWRDIYARSLQGEILADSEDTFTLNDTTHLTLSWATHPWYTPEGNIGGIIVVTKLINELVQAREAALETSRLKSQFLANMSHEIRTPMNGVLGMTDLLMTTPLNKQQQDFVDTLRSSAHSLLLIINDILDFSKIEAGQMRLDNIDFNLNTCVEEVSDLLATQATAKSLELFTLVDPNIPFNLKGDPSRLRQIFTNLVGNAIKFTDFGEVVLKATLESETFDHVTLRFEVKDTGIGISPESQQRLFQAFSQEAPSPGRKYEGTGLGLTICQQLVRLMDGEIGVESQMGFGSTFWFTVTFERGVQTHSPALLPTSQLQGLRGLVIDDHALTRQVIKSYAEVWGMEIDEAENVQAALTALYQVIRNHSPYDIAIINCQSSKINPEILAQFLSLNSPFSATKWIVMGSVLEHETIKNLMEQGASGYLLKPLKASKVKESLINVINKTTCELNPNVKIPTQLPDCAPKEFQQKSFKILVVEDTPINQKVILHQLKLLNYPNADCVSNGQEALDQLSHTNYDLILMDCLMPILDGYETTKAIRHKEGNQRHTPIVAMTAKALKGERDKCIAAGMDDYLSKPIEIEKLEAILNRWKSVGNQEKEESITLDLDRLNNLSRGDVSFQKELLNTFLKDAPIYLKDLKEAIEKEDYVAVAEQAHRLKGAASVVAIEKVPAIASSLQSQAQENSLENALLILDELQSVIDQVKCFVCCHFP
ncbi:MAG: PAS domain-containing protein [Halothece sp.]